MENAEGRAGTRPTRTTNDTDQGNSAAQRCTTPELACPLATPLCGSTLCLTAHLVTPTGSAPAAHRRVRRPSTRKAPGRSRSAAARWSPESRKREAFRTLRAVPLDAIDRAELLSILCSGGAR